MYFSFRMIYSELIYLVIDFKMRGDVINSIRWDEVNDCGTFQDWKKRRVKLYGKVVENLELDNKIKAEQWLYKYYRKKKKWKLLYEDEEDE